MRQTISRMIAAIAVVAPGTVPASACGFDFGCGPVVAPVYSGCNPCGGWAVHERLPDPEVQYGYTSGGPVHQYYYAEQGPTYTGPGDFAPRRVYEEDSVGVWGGYYGHRRHYYGYHPHMHMYGYHHGYALPPRVYYGAHHNMRYGFHGRPQVYGGHMMRHHY